MHHATGSAAPLTVRLHIDLLRVSTMTCRS